MVDPLCTLDALSVPLARPDPNLLATAQPVIADPFNGLGAEVGSAHAGLLDHPPAPAGLGEYGIRVVIHPGEPTADRLPH